MAISVPAALSASQLVKAFLFETQPNDAVTLVLAGAVLIIAAILPGYVAARRASRISPNQLIHRGAEDAEGALG